MSRPKKLSARQQRFVELYLVSLNAAQAAKDAGYSEKTANREGSRLLSKVDIQAALATAQLARQKRTEIDQDYVLRGLKSEAEYREEGSSHTARVKAYELLGKHLRLFPDAYEHTGAEGGPIQHEHTLESLRQLPPAELLRLYRS